MLIQLGDLNARLESTLVERGFTSEEAKTIAAPIIWAVTHGNNQGLLKLVGEPALKKKSSKRPISVLKETPCSVWMDGGENNGMIIMQEAVDKARELLKKSMVAVIGIKGVRSSCGALAYFTQQIAEDGNVAMMIGRTPPTVAPFESIEALFGTNPLAVSFPTEKEPINFDMATAAIAWYGLVLADAEGKEVDPTCVIDGKGKPTSNPSLVMKEGSVLPFDRSYKGSSIGMLVELIGGPFVGGAFCDSEGEWGNLIVGLNPDMFVGKEQFRKSASALVEKLRSAKTNNGEVRLPGDRANQFHSDVVKAGAIEVPDKVLTRLGWS